MTEIEQLEKQLNANTIEERLEAISKIKKMIDEGSLEKSMPVNNVNNHIHTTYSFSPYSPTKAIYMAWKSGLRTAGIMDHDSISGAEEFIQAGKIMEMATTIGTEMRVDVSKTELNGKKINNPDQNGIIYMAVHGIPHQHILTFENYFKKYRVKRNERNRKMVEKINEFVGKKEIALDFDKDVLPLSLWNEGGSVTERHLLYALSKKLLSFYKDRNDLVSFLNKSLEIETPAKIVSMLTDLNNHLVDYDLLGVLKSDVRKFYLPATEECPDVTEVIELCNMTGGISAYAYLGDVGNSATGDKRAQYFEDGFLDLLFDVIKKQGFNAVTYMPSRNTKEQIVRLKALCAKYEFFEISGEDINQPRQSFICEALKDPFFANLFDSTYALIGHEIEATKDVRNAMFHAESIAKYPTLENRINHYKIR